jgi:2-amino-4-hydroxy-6-hydroxymethyldihydropteridine diphosphokinase/dihydropteroate synthase
MIFAIGIGTNLGNRILNIEKAIQLLRDNGISILKHSLIYQNQALVLDKDKNNKSFDINFFNLVVICESEHIPQTLLKILKSIEDQMGRDHHSEKWSPRIIDLDLIFYDNLVLDTENLNIPHLGLIDRKFVLLPLLEIAPQWRYPIKNSKYFDKTIGQIVQEIGISTNDFINTIPLDPKIMAIINITPDSFSKDGLLDKDINQTVNMIWSKFQNGASILDFGFQSTRPNAEFLSPEIEINRAKNLMGAFFSRKFNNSPICPEISIDSFHPEVIEFCIQNYKVDIINDVSGLAHPRMLDLIAGSDRKIVLMHNLGVPPKSSVLIDQDGDVIEVLCNWFEKKIEYILSYDCGSIKKDQIILDPGIGFGKSIAHSWQIIQNLLEIKDRFGIKILFGHSKKSFMKNINISGDRSCETIGLSLKVAKDADYLRIHDVESHIEAISSYQF